MDFNFQDTITIRLQTQLDLIIKGAAINELVWTNELIQIKASSIYRRCFIQVVQNQEILAPYDGNGSEDLFYIRFEATIEGDAINDLKI